MNKLGGMNQVTANITNIIKEINNNTLKGLIRGAIIIIRDTEKTSPITPLDLGNLRASRFLVTSKGSVPMGKTTDFTGTESGELAAQHNNIVSGYAAFANKMGTPLVILGYSAYYASTVHENTGAPFKRPNSGAKWLESSIKRNTKAVLNVIRNEASF